MALHPGDRIPKQTGSVQPYGMDWTAYLAGLIDAPNDTIVTSTWVVTSLSEASPTLTTGDASIVDGGLQTQVRLSGGTAGVLYGLTNTIETASGAIDSCSIEVMVQAPLES